MRLHILRRRRWLLVTIGLLLGAVAGSGAGSLAGTVAVRDAGAPASPVLDATHLPPLLTLPGERVELEYDVHCAPGESSGSDETCLVRGTVFARTNGAGTFSAFPLTERSTNGIRRLVSVLPSSLVSTPAGLEYYAVIEAPELDRHIVVPAGGAAAPHMSRQLRLAVDVDLGRHDFGHTRRPDSRLASARWGSGDTDVGLEGGHASGTMGASAFDVDAAGRVLLLDQAHRRLLRWDSGQRSPVRVPLAVQGTVADIAASSDGSLYVLESVAQRGRIPLVRRFDDDGRELEAVEIAERGGSQLRRSPRGPLVLSQPSHHWTPVQVHGAPASRADQVRHGRAGRTMPDGSEVVILRRGNELRAAIVSGTGVVTRAWRVTSETPLAEVQLAETRGSRLVVVLRVYAEPSAEFVVLVLDRSGLRQHFAIETVDWAESAPLGRFKLVGPSLYRLGSTPAAAFVDRFDLEVQ
jgi:hypothetical protein